MKILLVDDEQLAREHLKRMLRELGPDYQLVAEAANGEQAVAACDRHEVDLVLMDIHMPGMDGLQAAKHLSDQAVPPAIIFATAYSEHALSAFGVSAVDYLLKPIRREKLLAALKKAASITRPQLAVAGAGEAVFLLAHVLGGVQRILLDDVFYLRADNKYVTVRHAEGEALLEESLKSLAARYPGQFLRIHRNALVALKYLIRLQRGDDGGWYAVLDGLELRPVVSRRHLGNVKQALLER